MIKNSQCQKECEAAKRKLEEVELKIYQNIAEENAKTVTEQVTSLDTFDGNFNQIGMWKIKKKLCPRPRDPPTAKKDESGNLITAPSALKELYLRTYIHRLEHRKIKERYQDIRELKSELWDLRFEILKEKPSVPWTLADLEKASKCLRINQSREPEQYDQ